MEWKINSLTINAYIISKSALQIKTLKILIYNIGLKKKIIFSAKI
jgi:hypothetical protein